MGLLPCFQMAEVLQYFKDIRSVFSESSVRNITFYEAVNISNGGRDRQKGAFKVLSMADALTMRVPALNFQFRA